MAETRTPRVGVPQWSTGTDPRPDREKTNTIHQTLEDQVALYVKSGPLSARPAYGKGGVFFCATDQGNRVYYDTGASWVALNTTGGGGPGVPVVIGGTGAEGTSFQSARADHTHALPLASADNAGAMPSQWAQLCGSASSAPNVNSLAQRDSGGRLSVNDPTSAKHAVNMDWVQSKAGSTTRSASTLARRTDAGRLKVANPAADDDAATKEYVDGRYPTVDQYATGGTVMRRWSSGAGANVEDPKNPAETANKRYTDSRASRREWKKNIRPNPYGLDEIMDLTVYRYDYRDGAPAVGENQLGSMVDELHETMPLLTTSGEDGAPERIRDRDLVWVLVQAVQELTERVTSLEEELDYTLARVGGGDDA